MDRAVFDRMEEVDGQHWWFVARRDIVSKVLARYSPRKRDSRILEVGCGTGSNLPMLRRFGPVEAIEPDDQARAVAIKRFGVKVEGGFLPHGLQLEDGTYDLIVMLDVLEHVGSDVESLAVLRQKLSKEGKLIVTVPAMPWLWSAHDVAHHHHRRYTRQALEQALDSGGFEVVHQSHFNTLLFPLIAAARLIGRLLGREAGDDRMPPTVVNGILKAIFGAEQHWVPRFAMPFGVSLICVAAPKAS